MSAEKKIQDVCEESVFEGLFMGLSKSLRDFLYFKSGDLALSADLVQDIFIKLWNNCDDVPYEKARSYLFVLAKNHFLKDIERKKVRLKFKNEAKPKVNREDPQYELERTEYRERLELAIDALPEGQREVFLMNRVEKKTYVVIADELGVSQTAVEKRMQKALLKMKSILSPN